MLNRRLEPSSHFSTSEPVFCPTAPASTVRKTGWFDYARLSGSYVVDTQLQRPCAIRFFYEGKVSSNVRYAGVLRLRGGKVSMFPGWVIRHGEAARGERSDRVRCKAIDGSCLMFGPWGGVRTFWTWQHVGGKRNRSMVTGYGGRCRFKHETRWSGYSTVLRRGAAVLFVDASKTLSTRLE